MVVSQPPATRPAPLSLFLGAAALEAPCATPPLHLPLPLPLPFPAPTTITIIPMSECASLVARTGRSHQRYQDGFRLVAGCIPYRFVESDAQGNGVAEDVPSWSWTSPPGQPWMAHGPDRLLHSVQVLMITSQHGQGLLFPKGGWETDETAQEAALREAMEEAGVRGQIQADLGTYEFRSKRHRSDLCRDGACRASIFALSVTEVLQAWPESDRRSRFWVSLPEAVEKCRHDWMKSALERWAGWLESDLSKNSSGKTQE